MWLTPFVGEKKNKYILRSKMFHTEAGPSGSMASAKPGWSDPCFN